MIKSKLLFLFTMVLISRTLMAQSDMVSIKLGHEELNRPIYVLEGLQLDSASFFTLSLNRKQIKKTVVLTSSEAFEKYGRRGEKGDNRSLPEYSGDIKW